MKVFFFAAMLLAFAYANGQPITLGVQGSSTASGVGAVSSTTWNGISDSGWVAIVNRVLKQEGKIDTTQRRSASAMDIYNGMWTGYIPPPDRNSPNAAYNCSAVMSRVPKPDVVLVNYPSTSYDIMSVKEVIERLQDIKNWYNTQGAVCFLLTTQPRDNFDLTNRQKLRKIADTITQVFGVFAIDIYRELADESGRRKTKYAAPDQLHLNNAGHRYIAQQVLAKNVTNLTPLPIAFRNVKTVRISATQVRVEFDVEDMNDKDEVFVNIDYDNTGFKRYNATAIIPKRRYYIIINLKQ